MKWIKLFEGFKELEFINTKIYRGYVKNKFKPYSLDHLLDHRSEFKKLKDLSNDESDIVKFDKEIKAIDFILSKHF
jgi:hypothetical protein